MTGLRANQTTPLPPPTSLSTAHKTWLLMVAWRIPQPRTGDQRGGLHCQVFISSLSKTGGLVSQTGPNLALRWPIGRGACDGRALSLRHRKASSPPPWAGRRSGLRVDLTTAEMCSSSGTTTAGKPHVLDGSVVGLPSRGEVSLVDTQHALFSGRRRFVFISSNRRAKTNRKASLLSENEDNVRLHRRLSRCTSRRRAATSDGPELRHSVDIDNDRSIMDTPILWDGSVPSQTVQMSTKLR